MRSLLFFLTLFLLQNFLYSRESKTIKYTENEKIEFVTLSVKYLTVFKSNTDFNTYNLSVYDRDGNIVFSRNNLDKYVKFAESVSEFNSLIYITQKSNNKILNGENLDEITSVNLRTGEENWHTDSYAAEYELSVDRKYLITKVLPIDANTNALFEVLDVFNGTKILQKKFDFAYYATWYDEDQILFAFQEYSADSNPKYIAYSKMKANQADLIHERQLLTIKFKKGFFSEEEYLEQKKKLDMQIDSLKVDIKTKFYSTRFNSIRREVPVFSPAKLKIYNIKTDRILLEKSVYDATGNVIYFAPIHAPGLLSVDKNRNIYFRGEKKMKDTKLNDFLIKINANMELVWEYHINHPYKFSKILFDHNLYFGFKNLNNYYLLNTDNQKFDSNQIQTEGLLPKNINVEDLFDKQLNIIPNGLEIDEEKRVILIQNVGFNIYNQCTNSAL